MAIEIDRIEAINYRFMILVNSFCHPPLQTMTMLPCNDISHYTPIAISTCIRLRMQTNVTYGRLMAYLPNEKAPDIVNTER